jgi:type I restriction enzyme, S subunit
MKELRMKFRWETEFKETEIGEIPREWEVSKIGIFYKLKYGITATSSEFGNCRLLRQTDLKEGMIDISSVPYSEVSEDEIQKYLLKDDDLVISRIANVGSIGYVSFEVLNSLDKPLIFGSYLLKFEKIKEIHNKFTFYFLLSPQMQDYIKSIADGSTRQNTNAKVVAEFPLYVPPLPEQSRIATVLSWFDDLIEVKKRQNEILEKTAMAIFKSWFIDFEPFRDGEFVYSEELGKEIPKGWEVKRLYELCKILRGLNFKSNEVIFEYVKGYIPVLRTNNIKGGFEIDFSDLMFVKEDKINPEKLLKENDILLSASNGNPELVGNFAVFLNTFTDLAFSFGAFIYLIRVNNHEMFPYVYLSLSDNSFREYVASAISGTNINNLNLSDLKNFPVLIPPSHILQSFHSLVEPLFQKIILNQKQIMTLRKIRDTLLPLLVFGKLRVEEV